MKKILIILIVGVLGGCQDASTPEIGSTITDVPEWSKEMIWYQIFPERFRNGDPTNDPRPQDMRLGFPEYIPEDWTISRWGADWYREDDYMLALEGQSFQEKAQLRRYGGDLQGVLDQLDYLQDLGITGVYFNPVNDAPSLHKYDPRHWRHVDRNFGPNPDGDIALMEMEDPIDPSTWKWTSADSLFLEVVRQLHARNIRVIMDFSWNHTGYDFWAVNDIRNNEANSPFKDWYEVTQFDDPNTPENETQIKGWWGFKYLPLIKENVVDEESMLPHEGNVASESFKQHVYHVTQRWMDPNGDGNFEDGVDGFRMDVASEMTMGWWRDYRKFVKRLNPEALLVAEVWWFDWPDLSGPEKMVQGDQFDALMNYRWFALSSGLFKQSGPQLNPSEFVSWYDSINQPIDLDHQQAMMNIVATHDTPRLSTSLFNESRFDQGSKLAENSAYKVHRPDAATWQLMRMYLLHQYSFVGAPHIWNGDELGMWGANDPDDRKPMWWPDIEFESESAHPYDLRSVPPDEVKADTSLTNYYKKLIQVRTQHQVLSRGDITYVLQDDDRLLFGYARSWIGEKALALFNLSDMDQQVTLEVEENLFEDALSNEMMMVQDSQLKVDLPAGKGRLLLSR